ncbi:SPOR domain-containing protein [Halorhodospira halophila]|uniref:Sporulation domain protein n=1 Tax=Halorhodospira halophila (strain DSM 244 / SL1) TaxID=349124 RepID=A1WT86_HALHL|nr:AAA family ATPase [Halorhodospira halophila]ABM60898.1 Sporulation domain protein [Halorhodospira halophila SL1]
MAPQTGTPLTLPEAALYRLGLTAQPFVGTPEPPFEDSARVTQLNVTLSLLQSGERIVLINGDAGLGKSTFLCRLAALQPPGLSMQRVDGHNAGLDTLWGALVAAAESEEGAQASRTREQALNYVRSARRGGIRPALLLDDVDALPPGHIEELLELWAELSQDDEAFSLAMALDPGELQKLPATLSDERFHTTTLYPLDQEQTAAYLDHRVRSAGAEQALFDRETVREIFHRSGGHPERINEEAHRRLTARLANPGEVPPAPRPVLPAHPGRRGLRWALAGVSSVAAAVAGTYWLIAHQLPSGPSTDELAIEDFEEPEEETVAAESDEIEPASDTPFGLELPGRYSFRDDHEEADTPSTPDQPTETLQLLEIPSGPAQEPSPTEDAPTIDHEADEEAAPTAEQDEDDWAAGAAWVLNEEADRYTIQVLAASQPTTLEGYAEQHDLGDPTHVVSTERGDGDPWFLLLHGSHEDREAAHAALAALPEEIAERGAWVRSFESVEEGLVTDD